MHVWLIVFILGCRVTWVLRQAVIKLAVEQVELQFERHHRADATLGQTLKHTRQHFTGLELDRLCGAVGRDQHLGDHFLLPTHRLQRTRH
ncbi:hypothetical protein D3C80_1856980 [compost metagenome]